MTVSLHETPAYLFPGTGFPNEIGGRGAEGTAVNVALPPGTTDADWLRAFHAVVPQVLRAHKPSVLVTQHGCDSHRQDPLADLNLTLDGQRASYLALASLADELCGGRWVSMGGGGYAVLDVVPRAWTHLLAIVSGEPIDPSTSVPETWLAEMSRSGPLTMSDGADATFRRFEEGFAPHSRVDQAILATRQAVFPELGLDPSL
jgi:acetoin utilization protein AcuC